MKIRIKGNSLRLRLLRREVSQLGEFGRVTETIQFGALPHEQLTYSLEVSSNAKAINAQFTNNQIMVTIPKSTAKNWVETEQITLENNQLIENGIQNNEIQSTEPQNVLKILIEKDFVCLDRKNDPDNADAFPYPAGKCG
jgi:predicted transcriptional regulator